MVDTNSFSVRRAAWSTDQAALAAIRREVFVVEQHVPEAEEWDGLDASSVHVLAVSAEGQTIGTGRLLPDGRIGRMAVLKSWRRRGVGGALLRELIGMACASGFTETRLHAQTHARAFYSRYGYVPVGEEFMEAGIPHIEMRLTL